MNASGAPAPAEQISAEARMGTVELTVRDSAGATAFYERALGLRASDPGDGTVTLQAPEGETLVRLHPDAAAPPRGGRATGLFHLAILLPSRRDLAFALLRLLQTGWSLDGASDHLVSEALYLSDPEGNGIELYRDRPREEWPRRGGALRMATLPLDLDGLLAEVTPGEPVPTHLPRGTTIGHVHLQVGDLESAEAFYGGILGFEVTVREYPGARFLSAGGYHHHIGLNVWRSRGSAPAAPGTLGLHSFEVVVPAPGELAAVVERVQAAGVQVGSDFGGALARDPSGNLVRLRHTG